MRNGVHASTEQAISVQARHTVFGFRALLFVGGILSIFFIGLGGLLHPVTLTTLCITLVAGFFYYKLPVETVRILALDGEQLVFIPGVNAMTGLGEFNEDEQQVDISDIAYIMLTHAYMIRQEYYMHLRLYLRDIGQTDIWINGQYSEQVCRIVESILDRNPDTRLINDRFFNIQRVFSGYSARILDALPENENFEPWKIDLDQKQYFTDSEWQILLEAPLNIFTLVARADGTVQSEEIRVFIERLKQAQQYRSLLVSQIFSSLSADIEMALEQYKNSSADAVRRIQGTRELVEEKLGTEQADLFAHTMYELGAEIVMATGERYQWVNRQEYSMLEKLKKLLRIDPQR